MGRRLSGADEAILLQGAVDLGVFLQVLQRVGRATESVGHVGERVDEGVECRRVGR